MTPCDKVGNLRQQSSYVRVLTTFFYWLSSKGAKVANLPTPKVSGTLVCRQTSGAPAVSTCAAVPEVAFRRPANMSKAGNPNWLPGVSGNPGGRSKE